MLIVNDLSSEYRNNHSTDRTDAVRQAKKNTGVLSTNFQMIGKETSHIEASSSQNETGAEQNDFRKTNRNDDHQKQPKDHHE